MERQNPLSRDRLLALINAEIRAENATAEEARARELEPGTGFVFRNPINPRSPRWQWLRHLGAVRRRLQDGSSPNKPS